MSRDNILYSIIGLLLGVIVGFVFANTVNQRGHSPQRTPAGSRGAGAQAAQDAGLPPDHPSLPANAAEGQEEGQADGEARIEQARAEPNNFEAQMEAAAFYYRTRRYDEALEFLMRANQLRPDSYETIVALGNTNFDAGRYELAERWYTAALVKQPKDINVRTDLGLTFLFRQPPDMERAIREFRTSLETDPKHEQTLQNLVVALTKKGDLEEAGKTLARLEQVNPGNQSMSKLRSDIEAARASATGAGPAGSGSKRR
ncbi:MAG TPA: tetratricopeptide repeat protein [Pyrinomonadaceae bacterium]|jgi:tetratricopeptide (TPR) repeat protein